MAKAISVSVIVSIGLEMMGRGNVVFPSLLSMFTSDLLLTSEYCGTNSTSSKDKHSFILIFIFLN